jgi:hypothetical protein
VEYLLLGSVYASLAPTRCVHAYTAGSECVWGGSQDVCKVPGAVSDPVDKGKAATSVNSKSDGSLELTADVTLGVFIDNRVIVFPSSILDQIPADEGADAADADRARPPRASSPRSR